MSRPRESASLGDHVRGFARITPFGWHGAGKNQQGAWRRLATRNEINFYSDLVAAVLSKPERLLLNALKTPQKPVERLEGIGTSVMLRPENDHPSMHPPAGKTMRSHARALRPTVVTR
jgi:hypothetical protein